MISTYLNFKYSIPPDMGMRNAKHQVNCAWQYACMDTNYPIKTIFDTIFLHQIQIQSIMYKVHAYADMQYSLYIF